MSSPHVPWHNASKNQLRNMAKRSWLCRQCGHTHTPTKPGACTVCGHKNYIYFASEAELRRYRQLKLLLQSGQIKNLSTQVVFPFKHNGIEFATYRADFVYEDNRGERVVEDVKAPERKRVKTAKGYKTIVSRDREFVLKKRMMAAFYGIEVREVEA